MVTFFGLPEARVLRSLPAGMDYGAQVGSREDLDAAFDAGLRSACCRPSRRVATIWAR